MTAVLSRRGVLGAGAVALGIGATAGTGAAAAAAPADSAPTEAARSPQAATSAAAVDPLTPVRSMFTGREGAVYAAFSSFSAHELVLDRVGDLPGGGDAEHRFRVEFRTDDSARDGLYRLLQNGELVALLYFVRVTEQPRLEAIVDRGVGA